MKYKNRYTDKAKQNAYMNACDCLYFGFGKIFGMIVDVTMIQYGSKQ